MLNISFNQIHRMFSFILLMMSPAIVEGASITIDPGHSPKKPGVLSCGGKSEYLFNEVLSQYIANRLINNNITVRSSRAAGTEASLDDRASSSSGTDLLLSIHHDSVQPQFIIKDKLHNGNCSDKAAGFSIFISARNHYYQKSLSFAKNLGRALVRRGLKPTLHHAEPIPGESRKLLDSAFGVYQFDELHVLAKAATPAVLLEVAVIVNPNDERRATSKEFRSKLATSVIEMIRQTE